MASGLLLTLSRGGMLSFIAAMLVMTIIAGTNQHLKRKLWLIAIIAGFIVITVMWLGATPIIEKFLTIKAEIMSQYFGGRFPIWEGTFNLIKGHLLQGTGLGTFNHVFPQYQPSEIGMKHYTYAHSDILELVAETGVLGTLIVAGGVVWLIHYFSTMMKMQHEPWRLAMSLGLMGSFASIMVHSLVDFNLKIPSHAILLMIIVALAINVLGTNISLKHRTPKLKKLKPLVLIGGFLLCGLFVIQSIRPALADYYANADSNEDTMLKKAISLDPLNAEYYYQRGILQFDAAYSHDSVEQIQTELENAISSFTQAVTMNRFNSKYHQSLAWTYGQLSRLTQEIPGNHDQHHKRTVIQSAHHHFKQAIKLEPENPYRYRAYAHWLFEQHDPEDIARGVTVYREAIKRDPKLISEALQRYFEIEKKYSNLKLILPDNARNHARVMEMLLHKGLWDSNIEDFKTDMRTAASPYYYAKTVSNYYLKKNDIRRSLNVLLDYTRQDPDCADAYFTIADRIVYAGGDQPYATEDIKKYYEKSLSLDPDNDFYRWWYAVYLFRTDEYAEAERHFTRLISSNPKYIEKIALLKKTGGAQAE
ncbi:MAG: hypothetical protein GF384_00740 [Elusimicrobia bacterium]|nr:hypothetical protein [Elusimicrobiota bacterium]